MTDHLRRVITVAAVSGALVALGGGLALADGAEGSDGAGNAGSGEGASGANQPPPGGGSGLSGGPTDAQLVQGAPAAPLPDPTLGAGSALPPAYNGLGTVADG